MFKNARQVVLGSCVALVLCACSSHRAGDAPAAQDPTLAKLTRGYERVEKDGQQFYCRDERPVGSHMIKTVCLTEEQLRANADATQQDLHEARKRTRAIQDL